MAPEVSGRAYFSGCPSRSVVFVPLTARRSACRQRKRQDSSLVSLSAASSPAFGNTSSLTAQLCGTDPAVRCNSRCNTIPAALSAILAALQPAADCAPPTAPGALKSRAAVHQACAHLLAKSNRRGAAAIYGTTQYVFHVAAGNSPPLPRIPMPLRVRLRSPVVIVPSGNIH